MVNVGVGELVLLCVVCGAIAGMIAYTRLGGSGAFIGFFLFGSVLPLIGIIAACLAKAPPPGPQPPGWYADPSGRQEMRWWDGYRWTWHAGSPASPDA